MACGLSGIQKVLEHVICTFGIFFGKWCALTLICKIVKYVHYDYVQYDFTDLVEPWQLKASVGWVQRIS